ncbi:1-acyl-sn-glycerol-3-phosphate acyltransferase beta [Halyomorpha halys]|uniref:1-acyl-sn-glycerol-3-phosphate acyltransferase beta n=1 Tax=Halyomorpha halys TaxID=286706 RepID=UPI0006D4CF3B|nr:1-acyl-sn-glycerol-3-phosphate acyltransferase beta-like [Halyomorpha halys]
MAILNEVTIAIAVIIVFFLPLLPNKKLRYYSCSVCFGIVLSLIGMALLPLGILRPRNILNLKFGANIVRYYTKILGIEWTLRRGDILKKDRGAVIVANHQYFLDILGMLNIWDVMDKCTGISKKEILYYFPYGPLTWLGGIVFIDRKDPKSAMNKLESAVRDLLDKKAKLWIFPEGTRNKKEKVLLPFKKGAFTVAISTQAPIIPVVYSPYSFIDSVNKTFSRGKMVISVLEPISTEGLTLDDVDSLKEKTYKLMSDEFEKLQKEVKSLQQTELNRNNS